MLYQIDRDGNGNIIREWEDIKISSPNSMVVIGEIAYFGQNKMVTCFNTNTGEQVAGFKDINSGVFEEEMMISGPKDLEAFKEMYGIEGEIERIY